MSRRSTRLSKQTAVQREGAERNNGIIIDSDSESVLVESDYDSDYARHRAKRQKKPLSSKKPTSRNGRKAQKNAGPSLFETMPIDILFEILAYLRPYDMLLLARTNHTFRNHLMSRNAQLLWKHARDVVDTPPPPPSCSEPKWANLLFGGSKCQHCGTVGIQRVDFGLCRRLCTSCLKRNLVLKNKFHKKFPDYDIEILDLISYTNIGGWAFGRSSNSKFYWEDDIHAMHEKLAGFRKDITLQKPNAKATLDSFKKERVEIIAKIQEEIPTWSSWHFESVSSKSQEKREWQDRRKTEIKDAFVKLGYKQVDVNDALNYVGISANDKPMTAGIWTKARKRYEPLVIVSRDRRLLPVRTEALKPTYNNWMKTLRPEQWACMPPLWVMNRHPVVMEAFGNESGGDIENPTEAEYAHLASKFAEIGSKWQTDMVSPFDQMLGNVMRFNPDYVQRNKDLAVIRCSYCTDVCIGVGEWATHAWVCPNGADTFSADGISRITCHHISTSQIQYLDSLINLLGKNPQTTTPAELDLLDPRFYCISCDKGLNKTAYTWRQFVSHSCRFWNHHAALVTNSMDIQVIHQQEASQLPVDGWLCAHCPDFYERAESLSVVKEHLLHAHEIQTPTEPQDYIWDFTKSRCQIRTPVEIQTQPPTPIEGEVQCGYCPTRDSADQIKIHVNAHHGTETFGRDPLLDRDFVRVKLGE